ncbi:hypothetical protein GN244_ATG03045 [Phytophthora infestans]|uniref:RxLR effector protein n=1 Tax=Phytophthora infestans TaxID=4787 RepID=A0A833TJU1_PHYIN|nr:hypothetical protein GN244_ATG03045 [Phytophthora infestans]
MLSFQNAIQSSGGAKIETSAGRLLRAELTTDETYPEERTSLAAVEKLNAKTKDVLKDKWDAANVKYQSPFIYNDGIGQSIMKRNIDPDKVFKYLTQQKLDRTIGENPQYGLWKAYLELWKKTHPRWKSKLQTVD